MQRKIIVNSVFGSLNAIFLIIGFLFAKIFNVTANKILSFPLTIGNQFISLRMDMGFIQSVQVITIEILKMITPLIFFVIALSFLIVYGVKFGGDFRIAFPSTLIASIIGFLLVPYTFTVFLAVGLLVSSFMITDLAQGYLKELKKWKNYRVGSNTLGKVFMVINIMIVLGLFFNLTANLNGYHNLYKDEVKKMALNIVPDESLNVSSELPVSEGAEKLQNKLDSSMKEQISKKLDETLQTKRMSAFIDFGLLGFVIVIFGILQLLKSILFSPLAGLITKFFT